MATSSATNSLLLCDLSHMLAALKNVYVLKVKVSYINPFGSLAKGFL